MKMENNYWIVDGWLIFKPEFNEELTNYYGIINKYKKIMFSNYKDPSIAIKTNNKYSNNLIQSKFNQEIFIPLNIKSLNMCCCNNQYLIDNLHNNIEELIIVQTNLNLDNLPNSIKKLHIEDYNKELNNLPNSIEYLKLINYYLKIKKIPKNLKTIKCNKKYKYIDDFKNCNVITY